MDEDLQKIRLVVPDKARVTFSVRVPEIDCGGFGFRKNLSRKSSSGAWVYFILLALHPIKVVIFSLKIKHLLGESDIIGFFIVSLRYDKKSFSSTISQRTSSG